MTMRQLQTRLTRLVREQDAIAQELYNRGLEAEWDRMEVSLTLTGQVCLAILDESILDELEAISSVTRPAPGEGQEDTFFKITAASA